jgi:lysophospholipase L1-like esterase
MFKRALSGYLAIVTLGALAFVGCSSDDSDKDGANGGESSFAGATNEGGATSSKGGATSTKGGATAAGGMSTVGGSNAAGESATAGATSGGTGSGGTSNTASGGTSAPAGGASTVGGTSAVGGSANVGGTTSAGGTTASAVEVALNETEYTFATPDLSHTLTATVTGAAATTVTWTSSNTYIATVSTAGVVTSVSGGQAVITATSTSDPTKKATATVTVAEPNRAKATVYVDPKSITSGPINILMCGDSLTRTYAANASDQTGWGQVLSQFFMTEVTVDNTYPNGGRSSRSFYNEAGRWVAVKTALAAAQTAGKPTFVFIMFGHNDQKKVTDTDGPSYLTFASQNPNGTVAGTYYDYLERYIVETRELGGIPVLFTPFVRQYLEGSPATVTSTGQHNITTPYTGEATARGDYPAAVKAVAAKHDVPVVDITSWSKTMVEARAAASTLDYVYISSDQTHIRNLGALMMAEEAVRSLKAQGILTNYAKKPGAKVMLDTNAIAFGGLYTGNTLDKTFRISPYGDVTGTITVNAPNGYAISKDGVSFAASTTIACDSSYSGSLLNVRFAPTDAIAYNADMTVAHTSIVPDYGNTVPNGTPGAISLTGNGKVVVAGTPVSVTWPMFSGTSITYDATIDGAVSASSAALTGLIEKNVLNGAARFDITGGSWPAETARNAGRYIQYTVPITTGSFSLDTISLSAGSGGGSNMRWDIVYSLSSDFSSPTALGTTLSGTKDTLVPSSYTSLGVSVPAGQTLYLRVYPYNTTVGTGKSIMLANVVVSGVTN